MWPIREGNPHKVPAVYVGKNLIYYMEGSFVIEILGAASAAHCGALWRTLEFISRQSWHQRPTVLYPQALYLLAILTMGMGLPPYFIYTQSFNFSCTS